MGRSNSLYGVRTMRVEKKQSYLLALTLLAFGFLGYQVYQLVGSDLSSTTASVEAPSLQAAPAPVPTPVSKLPLNSGSSLLKNQKEYLELINQYQLLKMRRQLLEEQAAIAQAQNRIALLNEQTRKLGVSLGGAASEKNHLLPTASNAEYQLSYIDQQSGHWTANIYHNGAYEVVIKGSMLSGDWEVKEISQGGVIIQKQNERRLITFNGMVRLPADPEKPKIAPQPKPTEYHWKAENIYSVDAEVPAKVEAATTSHPATIGSSTTGHPAT